MFLKSQEIKDSDYCILGEYIYVLKNNLVYQVNSFDLNNGIAVYSSEYLFFYGNDKYAIISVNNKGDKVFFSHNQTDLKTSLCTGKDDVGELYEHYIVNRTFSQDYIKEYLSVFDIKRSSYTWRIENSFFQKKTFNKFILTWSGDLLTGFDIDSETQIFHFTLSQIVYPIKGGKKEESISKERIQKVICHSVNSVWISLNTGRLINIEMKTGKGIHNILHPNKYPDSYLPYKDSGRLVFGLYTKMDKEEGKLFGLYADYYWEINLNDPENSFEVFDITESCRHFNIRPTGPFDFPWHKNEIFFGQIDTKGNTVGVFDREKREVVWAMKTPASDNMYGDVRKIDYQNNRLYVLGGNNTLYIYERE